MGVIARGTDAGDCELVAAVRDGDDAAFEELYRRYSRRVAGYVCRMVGDPDRAEDVTQEAFFSALRRLRRTDSEIAFKPWIFEIAKNASIDHFRRTGRAEEISIHAEDGGLRPADHVRLVGGGPAPEAAYEGKERLDNLKGAFDELSDSHSRILVLRELEGLSYREIGERMELTRPAVESTLFRARRRLNEEYAELDTGARCMAVDAAIARLAEGIESARDRRRVGRHAARCSACRRHAREMGVAVQVPIRSRVAALLPIPVLFRRRRDPSHDGGAGAVTSGGYASSVQQVASTWAPAIVTSGAAETTAGAWVKAAALVATLALAGGGVVIQARVVDADRGTDSKQMAPDAEPISGGGGTGGGPSGLRDGSGGSGDAIGGLRDGSGGATGGKGTGSDGATRGNGGNGDGRDGGIRDHGAGDGGLPAAPEVSPPAPPDADVTPPGVEPPPVGSPESDAVPSLPEVPNGSSEISAPQDPTPPAVGGNNALPPVPAPPPVEAPAAVEEALSTGAAPAAPDIPAG